MWGLSRLVGVGDPGIISRLDVVLTDISDSNNVSGLPGVFITGDAGVFQLDLSMDRGRLSRGSLLSG